MLFRSEAFRNEWKYLISTSEKEMLMLRLKPFLQPDPHAGEGGYYIRSLYFDDYWSSAYAEKEAGVLMRKKYRIRIYNNNDKIAFLTFEDTHVLLMLGTQFFCSIVYSLCVKYSIEKI